MSSAGRAVNSSGFGTTPKEREIGLSGFAAQIRLSSLTGSYGMATVEHREPCEIERFTHGCVSSEGWRVGQEVSLPGQQSGAP